MRTWVFFAAGLVALQALVLFLFGQPLVSETGRLMLWSGDVLSAENSQQFSDWYSFSHIIHGFVFYFFARLLFPRASWQVWLFLAVGAEVAWEILENTPQIINHYRQQALAQGYMGDSILNSVSDTLMAIGGFILARKLPTWVVVVLAVGMELFVLLMIRDNLTLNTLNLLYQFDFIKEWQGGGA